MEKTNCAIIGSGNIGTDLMLKIANTSKSLNLIGVIGIDPESEGLEANMSPPSLIKTVFWALSISLKVCLEMAKRQVGSLVIFQLSMSP